MFARQCRFGYGNLRSWRSACSCSCCRVPSSGRAGVLEGFADGTDYTDVTVTWDAPNGHLSATSATSSNYTFLLREVTEQPTVVGAESWSYDAAKQILRINASGTNVDITVTFSPLQQLTISELLTSEKGYTEVTSTDDLSAKAAAETYLFVLADFNYAGVATSASGKTRGELLMGIGQGPNRSNGAMYQAMVYETPADPSLQNELLWLLEKNNDGTYSLRNLLHKEYLFETDNVVWRIGSRQTPDEYTKVRFALDGTNGWTIQMNRNASNSGSYVGPWEAGEYDPAWNVQPINLLQSKTATCVRATFASLLSRSHACLTAL